MTRRNLPPLSRQKSATKLVRLGEDLPTNAEAEASLLGCMTLRPEICYEIQNLVTEEMFLDNDYRKMFRHLIKVGTNCAPMDINVVTHRLHQEGSPETRADWHECLAEVHQTVPSVWHYQAYSNLIVDCHQRRQADTIVKGLAHELRKNTSDPAGTIVAAHMRELNEISLQNCSEKAEKFPVEKMRELLKNPSARLLSTGVRRLDKHCSLRTGELHVLAARPSVGKTSLALNMAYSLSMGKHNCLFFSVEMTKEDLWYRLLSLRSGVACSDLMSGKVPEEDVDEMLRGIAREEVAQRLLIDDKTLTIEELETKSIAESNRGDFSVIFVDYLQLLRTNKRVDSRNYEVAEISARCKGIAKKLNCAIVLLSQLNREVEHRKDQKPTLADLRDSGAIEQDADKVWFMYRKEGDPRQVTRWFVGKNRNGPVGLDTEVVLNFSQENMRLA